MNDYRLNTFLRNIFLIEHKKELKFIRRQKTKHYKPSKILKFPVQLENYYNLYALSCSAVKQGMVRNPHVSTSMRKTQDQVCVYISNPEEINNFEGLLLQKNDILENEWRTLVIFESINLQQ